MSQNIVAYSLVGMFFYVLPSWMKYGNKNHNIFKIDYAKIMQNIFFYIKQKPLQPSIASFSSSSLSQMPLYQAPIIFSFKSWIAQGGRRPHAPSWLRLCCLPIWNRESTKKYVWNKNN